MLPARFRPKIALSTPCSPLFTEYFMQMKYITKLLASALVSATRSATTAPPPITLQPGEVLALQNKVAALVDVRRQDEWDLGHIENATFVANMASMPSQVAMLDGCQNCSIIIYCRSGSRAGVAIQNLIDTGFVAQLYNGLGTMQWTQAGYPLVNTPSVDPPCTSFEDQCELEHSPEPSPAPTLSPTMSMTPTRMPIDSPAPTVAPTISMAPTTVPSTTPTDGPEPTMQPTDDIDDSAWSHVMTPWIAVGVATVYWWAW